METDLSGFVRRSQNKTENIPQSPSWFSSSAEPAGTSVTVPSGPAPRLNWTRKSRNTRHWSSLASAWSTCLSLFPSKPRGLCCRRYKTSPTCTPASHFRRAFFRKTTQKTAGSTRQQPRFYWVVGASVTFLIQSSSGSASAAPSCNIALRQKSACSYAIFPDVGLDNQPVFIITFHHSSIYFFCAATMCLSTILCRLHRHTFVLSNQKRKKKNISILPRQTACMRALQVRSEERR